MMMMMTMITIITIIIIIHCKKYSTPCTGPEDSRRLKPLDLKTIGA
jgi:hypothetical protein